MTDKEKYILTVIENAIDEAFKEIHEQSKRSKFLENRDKIVKLYKDLLNESCYEARIVCDETNNSEDDIKNEIVNLDVYIVKSPEVNFINIDFVDINKILDN